MLSGACLSIVVSYAISRMAREVKDTCETSQVLSSNPYLMRSLFYQVYAADEII